MKYILVIAILLSFTVPEKAEAVMIRGAADCGQWLDFRKDTASRTNGVEFWVMGYLSALSFSTNKEFWESGNGLSAQQVMYWIDNYCRENPLSNVARAADTLFLERTLQ